MSYLNITCHYLHIRKRVKTLLWMFLLLCVVFILYLVCLGKPTTGCIKLRPPDYHESNKTTILEDHKGAILNVSSPYILKDYVMSSEIMKEFQFFLQNENVCKDDKIYLVAVVFSKPSNFKERQDIRKTWGYHFNMAAPLKIVFLIGQSDHVTNEELAQEYAQYTDIVVSSFKESYTNLVYKSIAMLQWTKQFCSHAKYLLKIDDDVFLYTNNLLSTLESVKDKQHFIMGLLLPDTAPFRDPTHKWFLSIKSYPFQRFPPYIDGAAYVISSDLVARLHEIARHKPRIHLEDAFITGLCAAIAGAELIDRRVFVNDGDTYYACFSRLSSPPPVTLHRIYPGCMSYF